ncbi:MAG: hypothetical protein AAF512_05640, partial [Pseudomonadota bacterium]
NVAGLNPYSYQFSPSPLIIKATSLTGAMNIFNVKTFFKGAFPDSVDYESGRVTLNLVAADPLSGNFSDPREESIWPGLLYTFDASSDFSELAHWRSMQRR